MHKEKGNVAMKKITVLILAVAIAVCMLGGCGGVTETPDASTSPEATTRTVTDMVGRTVEIPSTIEKICPLANTPRMITYLGLADKVVAISGFDYDTVNPGTAYAYASKEYWKDLPVAGTDGGGATDYYPEVIIAADPDIILCSYDKELADEYTDQDGHPVVSVVTGPFSGEDYRRSAPFFWATFAEPRKRQSRSSPASMTALMTSLPELPIFLMKASPPL
jgi:iron complex transport system substrate-binding protein